MRPRRALAVQLLVAFVLRDRRRPSRCRSPRRRGRARPRSGSSPAAPTPRAAATSANCEKRIEHFELGVVEIGGGIEAGHFSRDLREESGRVEIG